MNRRNLLKASALIPFISLPNLAKASPNNPRKVLAVVDQGYVLMERPTLLVREFTIEDGTKQIGASKWLPIECHPVHAPNTPIPLASPSVTITELNQDQIRVAMWRLDNPRYIDGKLHYDSCFRTELRKNIPVAEFDSNQPYVGQALLANPEDILGEWHRVDGESQFIVHERDGIAYVRESQALEAITHVDGKIHRNKIYGEVKFVQAKSRHKTVPHEHPSVFIFLPTANSIYI